MYCFASSRVAYENGRWSQLFSISFSPLTRLAPSLSRQGRFAVYCSESSGWKRWSGWGDGLSRRCIILWRRPRAICAAWASSDAVIYRLCFLGFLFTGLADHCPSYKFTRERSRAQVKNCFLLVERFWKWSPACGADSSPERLKARAFVTAYF